MQDRDEKEQQMEVNVKTITSGGTWENITNNALEFINSNNIQNMSQLIDITPSFTNADAGQILIYYWSHVPNQTVINSPILRCQTDRRNTKSQSESANMIKETVATHVAHQTLFKISHCRQSNKHPITFIWFWNIKPKNGVNVKAYDDTDHILRNHGNNVATMEKCCLLSKSVVNPMNIFQKGYDVNKYSYVQSSKMFVISFDRAYILNTLSFWLYDGDTRVFKYQIEISKNGTSWQQIANHENKVSWQTIQFDEQFVKYIRFLEGSSSFNQDFILCRFSAFFDYSLPFL